MSIRKALIHFFENKDVKPVVRPIASVGIDQFKKDVEVLSGWLEKQALAFFASILGLATGMSAYDLNSPNGSTSVAAKIYERLCDFAEVSQLYEGENPSQKISRVFPEFGKAKLEKVLDPDHKEDRFQWTNNREMIFLICMALEINKEDNQNVKRLFNLLGLTYARMADPKDILYAWSTELRYTYKQFCNLKEFIENLNIDLVARHRADVRALRDISVTNHGFTLDIYKITTEERMNAPNEFYDAYLQRVVNSRRIKEGREKQDELTTRQIISANRDFHEMHLELIEKLYDSGEGPLNYRQAAHTAQIEDDVRGFLEEKNENGLRYYMEKHKLNFHLCSITRAVVFEELLELRFNHEDTSMAKYNDFILGLKDVSRNDIIDLCCEVGHNLTKTNESLVEANFAPIDPDYEVIGRELVERERAEFL